MKRIIVAAILTVIFAVGTVTSFIVNDLPNVTQWMQTNKAQFKKTPKHDGPRDHKKDDQLDKQKKDGKHDKDRKGVPQDGTMNGGPRGGSPMPPQGAPAPQGNGQVPPQGNAPAVPQGAPVAPQDGQAAPVPQAASAQ